MSEGWCLKSDMFPADSTIHSILILKSIVFRLLPESLASGNWATYIDSASKSSFLRCNSLITARTTGRMEAGAFLWLSSSCISMAIFCNFSKGMVSTSCLSSSRLGVSLKISLSLSIIWCCVPQNEGWRLRAEVWGRKMSDIWWLKSDVWWLMLLNEHESHGLNEFISPALSRINRNITFRVTSEMWPKFQA